MQHVGKILWWNDKRKIGAIEDSRGNQIYFDISCLVNSPKKSIKENQYVTFQLDSEVDNCLSATKVKFAEANQQKNLRSQSGGVVNEPV